jgi:hypothetical protein
VTEGDRILNKLCNKEFRKIYLSSNIFGVIKSRIMRWARHVARMGRREMHTGFYWGVLKELDHFKYLDVGMRIILKCTFKEDGRTDMIHLAQNSVKWRSAATTVINLQTSYKTRSLLSSQETNCSKRTLLLVISQLVS